MNKDERIEYLKQRLTMFTIILMAPSVAIMIIYALDEQIGLTGVRIIKVIVFDAILITLMFVLYLLQKGRIEDKA